MNAFVLTLADPNATLEYVGGKGMSLAKMLAAGLPVPGGFHVTTAAYRRFVAENQLQSRIMRELEGIDPTDTAALETTARTISSFFAEAKTPPDIAAAVTDAYAALHDAAVAVRSSATAEDLPGASFAGQQETYLNMRGTAAVLDAVKQCWASLWTARAIAYRLNNQIDQGSVALAVVVQELVVADAAGIMFTANPINGNRDELVINAAWGLGEAVVSGAVTPDTITVQKATGRVLRRETAEKTVMTMRTEHGTREVAVPEAQQRKPVLTDAQTAELARLGMKIEQFYAMPMDVEWALAGDRFAIVQARPITALPPEWKRPDAHVQYFRTSLAEHTPSPVTPLFATLGLELANIATAEMWKQILGKETQSMLAEGYVPLNGYVYLGYRMGGANALKTTWVSMTNIGPLMRGSVARWQSARRELAAVVEQWEGQPIEELSASELLTGVRAVFLAACRYFTVIQSTLPAAAMSEVLFTRLYDRAIRRKGDPPATTFLLGFDTVALRAEKSLFDIAAWIRTSPALAEYMVQTPTEQLEADLDHETPPASLPASLWAEWQQRLQRHLGAFGRTAYEFDFARPTPQEMSGPVLDMIKAFRSGTGSDPYQRQRHALKGRMQAMQAVLERVGWPLKGWFLKLLRWAQETAPMREDSIFDLGMGHPLVRRMLAELGRRFMAGGAIERADDIYWLEKDEVEELIAKLESVAPLPDFAGRIPERKAQWQAALKVVPPVMLPEKSIWSRFFHGAEGETKDGKVMLKGVGTSGGRVTAPARVLFGPEDFGKLKPGDVLVAVTTTPAWTPLFALASAVVTDIGGPLSHSSIVAREYGIPAVMAARSATRAIQSGQRVTVDGAAGTVTLEEEVAK
ncbi:MAG TPA: PEP/pyruvate-binding domain-containing protein [Roseiflexaceae bacterium]|nr:PEP/pyruvate-binding domain-containing protein [Roseiflexaceae bacterium]